MIHWNYLRLAHKLRMGRRRGSLTMWTKKCYELQGNPSPEKNRICYPLEVECQNEGSLLHLAVVLTQLDKDENGADLDVFREKSTEILREIIGRKECDVNAVNKDKQTALHIIVAKNQCSSIDQENVKLLLSSGCDKLFKDQFDRDAMDILEDRVDLQRDNKEKMSMLLKG
eukprot:160568_1